MYLDKKSWPGVHWDGDNGFLGKLITCNCLHKFNAWQWVKYKSLLSICFSKIKSDVDCLTNLFIQLIFMSSRRNRNLLSVNCPFDLKLATGGRGQGHDYEDRPIREKI